MLLLFRSSQSWWLTWGRSTTSETSAEQTCSYRSVSPQYILKSSIWIQGSHGTIPESLTRRPTSSSPSSRACFAPTEISRGGRVEVYNKIHSGSGPRRGQEVPSAGNNFVVVVGLRVGVRVDYVVGRLLHTWFTTPVDQHSISHPDRPAKLRIYPQ